VEKKRREDAANGVKIAQSLEGFVERKVCDPWCWIYSVVLRPNSYNSKWSSPWSLCNTTV